MAGRNREPFEIIYDFDTLQRARPEPYARLNLFWVATLTWLDVSNT